MNCCYSARIDLVRQSAEPSRVICVGVVVCVFVICAVLSPYVNAVLCACDVPSYSNRFLPSNVCAFVVICCVLAHVASSYVSDLYGKCFENNFATKITRSSSKFVVNIRIQPVTSILSTRVGTIQCSAFLISSI